MKHLFLGLIATAVVASAACSGNADNQSTNAAQTTEATTIGATDDGNFSELFAHYQHLSSALSSDNAQEAANAAKGMLAALPKVESGGFSAEDKAAYDDIAAGIKENAEHIVGNAGDIAHQRAHLVVLSEDFYDIAKTFGTGKPLYKVYCSMYDNDKGAYWLSDTEEVKNPYYGASMLACGEVQEELM